MWYLEGIERLNLPSIMVTDGPHGLRKQMGDSDHLGLSNSVKATCFPTASALASTWDNELVYQVGEKLGDECLTEDVSVILGPGINIKRHPLCGRNFEYFSEDPYLSGKLASSLIKGIQSKGIGTSVKHYVANNQESMRMVLDTFIDERTLREIYLKGFEIAVKEAQPWTVMCSYNKINGTYVSENKKILNDILKEEWGHKGIVVTDWGATNNRVAGLKAGQELQMPGTKGIHDAQIVKAIKQGNLSEELLDQRVKRVLELIMKADVTLKKEKKQYNNIRPHEALGMKTPAKIHDFSTRPFPEKIPNFDYDPNYKVLKVTQNGAIRWKSYYWVYLTAALKGKYVGILDLGNGIWKVFYRNVFLGFFNENQLRNKQSSTRLETNLV